MKHSHHFWIALSIGMLASIWVFAPTSHATAPKQTCTFRFQGDSLDGMTATEVNLVFLQNERLITEVKSLGDAPPFELQIHSVLYQRRLMRVEWSTPSGERKVLIPTSDEDTSLSGPSLVCSEYVS